MVRSPVVVRVAMPRLFSVTVRQMLGVDAIPGLGFAHTGMDGSVSDRELSDAIYGFLNTSDDCTPAGVPLPGFPTPDRAKHEDVIGHRGWFRPPPSRETVALKYPARVKEKADVRKAAAAVCIRVSPPTSPS